MLSFSANPEYVQYFALILVLDALSAISFAKLREQNRAVRFASIRLFNIFVNIGLNLFFIVYCPLVLSNNFQGVELIKSIYSEDTGIGYIFIANLVASALTLLLFVPQMSKSSWRFDTELWKKMILYALPLMVAGLAGITNETIDRILLKYLLPADISASEIGLYSAFYKLSIIMTLFVQTFRFAAEPFFFAQEKEKNAKAVYALVMKYFTIVTAFIFLSVTIYYDLVKQFIGSDFHDERGAIIVPILLLANLFLGLYYNLSVWYKLTEKTLFGAYMSLVGAGTTIVLNLLLIPKLGFVGSAWATLCCYFLMVLCSYFLGRKHYPIPYPLGRIGLYFTLMLALYFVSINWSLGMLNNTFYLLIFIAVAFVLERPKKSRLNIY
jgi:O-antigen/teichoic acid export membrane protein